MQDLHEWTCVESAAECTGVCVTIGFSCEVRCSHVSVVILLCIRTYVHI